MADNKIVFKAEDGSDVIFTVIEEAKLGGVNYLLVLDEESDEEAYILTEVQNDKGEAVYEILEDEKQLSVIMDYFNDILEDVELEF